MPAVFRTARKANAVDRKTAMRMIIDQADREEKIKLLRRWLPTRLRPILDELLASEP
jgi:hypothetical protein